MEMGGGIFKNLQSRPPTLQFSAKVQTDKCKLNIRLGLELEYLLLPPMLVFPIEFF